MGIPRNSFNSVPLYLSLIYWTDTKHQNKEFDHMKKLLIIIPMVLWFCFICNTGWAEKVYVTDSLEITLRTGPSNQNKIIMMLRSGKQLELLKSKEGWCLVRVSEPGRKTVEGWALARYLIERRPWEVQAGIYKRENERLKEQSAVVEKELREITAKDINLDREFMENSKALETLRAEYDDLKQGAAGYLTLKKTHKVTQSKLKNIETTFKSLSEEHDKLKNSHSTKWFAMGALVLLFGLIIGLEIGRQQKRRKSSLLYD